LMALMSRDFLVVDSICLGRKEKESDIGSQKM
jgi:hypothetical protein